LAEVGRYYDSANDPVTLAHDPEQHALRLRPDGWKPAKVVLKQKDRAGWRLAD